MKFKTKVRKPMMIENSRPKNDRITPVPIPTMALTKLLMPMYLRRSLSIFCRARPIVLASG